MSIKGKFNDTEWFLLSSTPALIGATMSAAEGSGVIGTVKELGASMRATVEALKDYPDSELIQALLEKAENWESANEKMNDYRERAKEDLKSHHVKSKDDLRVKVLKDIAQCVELVDERCTLVDAQNYKEWSLKVANTVAMAAKEGGFFGFGGTQISEGEQAFLNQLENALGIKAQVLLA